MTSHKKEIIDGLRAWLAKRKELAKLDKEFCEQEPGWADESGEDFGKAVGNE